MMNIDKYIIWCDRRPSCCRPHAVDEHGMVHLLLFFFSFHFFLIFCFDRPNRTPMFSRRAPQGPAALRHGPHQLRRQWRRDGAALWRSAATAGHWQRHAAGGSRPGVGSRPIHGPAHAGAYARRDAALCHVGDAARRCARQRVAYRLPYCHLHAGRPCPELGGAAAARHASIDQSASLVIFFIKRQSSTLHYIPKMGLGY